jgi:hypothetical protein
VFSGEILANTSDVEIEGGCRSDRVVVRLPGMHGGCVGCDFKPTPAQECEVLMVR